MSLGNLTIDFSADLVKYEQAMTRMDYLTRASANKVEQSLKSADNAANSLQRSIAKIGATAAGALAVKSLLNYADQWRLVTAKIDEAAKTPVFNIAQSNYMGIDVVAKAYKRLDMAMADMGKSRDESLRTTDLLFKALRAGGASADTATDAMARFNYAMSNGSFDTKSFTFLSKNTPYLINQIAAGLGISRQELQKLAASGNLTADEVISALGRMSDKIEADAKKMPITVSGALGNVEKSFMQFVGKIDEGYGASANLASGISFLAENFEKTAQTALTASGVIATVFAGKVVSSVITSTLAIVNNKLAMLESAAATASKAQADTVAANIAVRSAIVERELALATQQRAIAAVEAAQAELVAAQAAVANGSASAAASAQITAAQATLSAAVKTRTAATGAAITATSALAAAEGRAAVATNALTVANRSASIAATIATTAVNGFKTVLALLGGPIGVAIAGLALLVTHWDNVASAAGSAAAKVRLAKLAIAGVTDVKSGQAAVETAKNTTKEIQDQIKALDEKKYKTHVVDVNSYDNMIKQKQAALKESLQAEKDAQQRLDEMKDLSVQKDRDRQNKTAAGQAIIKADEIKKQYQTKAEQLKAAQKDLDEVYKQGAITEKEYIEYSARINESFKDKGAASAAAKQAKEIEKYNELMDSLVGKMRDGIDPQYTKDLKVLTDAYNAGKISLEDYNTAVAKLKETKTLAGKEMVKYSQRVKEVTVNLTEAFNQTEKGWQLDLDTHNLSDYEREVTKALNDISEKAVEMKRRLTEDVDLKLIDPALVEAEMAKIDAIEEAHKAKYRETAEAKKLMDQDWSNGASRAFKNYADIANQTSQTMESAFTSTFSSVEDYLGKFITTGKASFRDFATSVTSDLAKVLLKMSMVRAVGAVMGMFATSESIAAATDYSSLLFASGGYVNGPGSATSDSIPAWLSNGEYVVSAAAVNRYGTSFLDGINEQKFATGGVVGSASTAALPAVGSAGTSIVNHVEVTINSDGTSSTSADTEEGNRISKQVLEMMKGIANEQIANNIRPGGLLAGVRS